MSACIKTKVTAPPTVPSKRAEELTGDEATNSPLSSYASVPVIIIGVLQSFHVFSAFIEQVIARVEGVTEWIPEQNFMRQDRGCDNFKR